MDSSAAGSDAAMQSVPDGESRSEPEVAQSTVNLQDDCADEREPLNPPCH